MSWIKWRLHAGSILPQWSQSNLYRLEISLWASMLVLTEQQAFFLQGLHCWRWGRGEGLKGEPSHPAQPEYSRLPLQSLIPQQSSEKHQVEGPFLGDRVFQDCGIPGVAVITTFINSNFYWAPISNPGVFLGTGNKMKTALDNCFGQNRRGTGHFSFLEWPD